MLLVGACRCGGVVVEVCLSLPEARCKKGKKEIDERQQRTRVMCDISERGTKCEWKKRRERVVIGTHSERRGMMIFRKGKRKERGRPSGDGTRNTHWHQQFD